MLIESILHLTREELFESKKNKKISSIDFDDFDRSYVEIASYVPLTVFIDDNGETKILKNRYGNKGEVK